jgi:putative endonuclease
MPRRGISNWYYVYVLKSEKDNNLYIGYTIDLKQRLVEHNTRKNFSTKGRTPFNLVYAESCLNEQDAKRRENYLETTQGGRFLKLRIKEYLKLN